MEHHMLISALKEGDQVAFKSLFEKYYKPLCAYLQTYTRDWELSEEIAQNTFAILWQKRAEINITSSFKAYLFKMAYNDFLMSLRQKKKEDKLLDELKYEALTEVIAEDESLQAEKLRSLEIVIEGLPPRCREILNLKQQGLKYSEIAEKLDISIKTVEAQLRIAFSKIKKNFRKSAGIFIFMIQVLRSKFIEVSTPTRTYESLRTDRS